MNPTNANLKKLPLGIQTFEDIRTGGYLYVDKTKYLVDLIDRGKVYFLSRPRRFGKSLTVSTFEALFAGRKDLFKGLYAEAFCERPDYRAHPIIHMDMSRVATNNGVDFLSTSILSQVKSIAGILDVPLPATDSPGDAFSALLALTADRHGSRVVVLVDEYDKPILDKINDREEAAAYRDVLRDLYTRIKSADASVHFVFVTGISKFVKTGIFSAMNNLTDISMSSRYAEMLGYTQAELTQNFAEHIGAAAKKMSLPADKILDEMKGYYDGYSFDGGRNVYNPYSIMCFLDSEDAIFDNYWFDTGSTSFIAEYLKGRRITVEEFRGVEVSRNFTSFQEIEAAEAESFLYQAGYLTLRPGSYLDFALDYPNREVLSSMSMQLTNNMFASTSDAQSSYGGLLRSFKRENVDGVIAEFNRLFAVIPYDDYAMSAKKAVEAHGFEGEITPREWLYRSTLLSYLYGAGLDVEAETHFSRGRPDLLIRCYDNVWIFELKVARGAEAAKLAAVDALAQIRERGYADSFARAVLVGIAIDDDIRSIGDFKSSFKGEPCHV